MQQVDPLQALQEVQEVLEGLWQLQPRLCRLRAKSCTRSTQALRKNAGRQPRSRYRSRNLASSLGVHVATDLSEARTVRKANETCMYSSFGINLPWTHS